ncbi:hypothetical protein [Peribacillus simplex]|uniref:hypothetical protein n=1 Tax=Peribacillus simplex TaxID=1478 RepID=UPI003D2DCEDC
MLPINNGKERIHQPNNNKMLSKQEIKAIESWVFKMWKYRFYKTPRQMASVASKTLKFKYKMIGNGLNRVVYDLNNGYILKIALSELGLISNANEASIYNNCKEEVRKYLCPIKEHGTGWIIMKKVDTKVSNPIKEYTKLIKLDLKFLRYGIIPIDLRLDNVGFTENNEMVVIDYGLFTMNLINPVLRWLVL